MEFVVLPTEVKHAPAEGCETGYLWTNQWDDWFTYSTMYYFTYFDNAGEKHEIGQVKIGQFNWQPKQRRPDIPERFKRLSKAFFSLGQDIELLQGTDANWGGRACRNLQGTTGRRQ